MPRDKIDTLDFRYRINPLSCYHLKLFTNYLLRLGDNRYPLMVEVVSLFLKRMSSPHSVSIVIMSQVVTSGFTARDSLGDVCFPSTRNNCPSVFNIKSSLPELIGC